MSKSLNRDIDVLVRIKKNQINIIEAIKVSGCSFGNTRNSLCNNKMAFDLCSFYMAQIGEKFKLLTDSSKQYLNNYINIGMFIYFRNMIDHDYERVNRVTLQSYIQQVIYSSSIKAIEDRIAYCISKQK